MKTVTTMRFPVLNIITVLCVGVTTASANLLLNPSVESGPSNTQFDNWIAHAGDTFREDTNSFGFTAAAMKDGLFGVKMFGGDGDLAQTNLLVLAGLTYDVSGWFYHSSTEDVIDNSALSTRMFMHVEWFDINGVSLGNDYSPNHNGTSPADIWVPIYAQFVAPVSAHHATFHVESDANVGGGSVFGDSFAFIPEPGPGLMALTAMIGLLQLRRKSTR